MNDQASGTQQRPLRADGSRRIWEVDTHFLRQRSSRSTSRERGVYSALLDTERRRGRAPKEFGLSVGVAAAWWSDARGPSAGGEMHSEVNADDQGRTPSMQQWSEVAQPSNRGLPGTGASSRSQGLASGSEATSNQFQSTAVGLGDMHRWKSEVLKGISDNCEYTNGAPTRPTNTEASFAKHGGLTVPGAGQLPATGPDFDPGDRPSLKLLDGSQLSASVPRSDPGDRQAPKPVDDEKTLAAALDCGSGDEPNAMMQDNKIPLAEVLVSGSGDGEAAMELGDEKPSSTEPNSGLSRGSGENSQGVQDDDERDLPEARRFPQTPLSAAMNPQMTPTSTSAAAAKLEDSRRSVGPEGSATACPDVSPATDPVPSPVHLVGGRNEDGVRVAPGRRHTIATSGGSHRPKDASTRVEVSGPDRHKVLQRGDQGLDQKQRERAQGSDAQRGAQGDRAPEPGLLLTVHRKVFSRRFKPELQSAL